MCERKESVLSSRPFIHNFTEERFEHDPIKFRVIKLFRLLQILRIETYLFFFYKHAS
jgi:hypothetical protein